MRLDFRGGLRYNPCSILSGRYTGVWRSWLARLVWDQEVEGSSPFTPTTFGIIGFLRNLSTDFSVRRLFYTLFYSLFCRFASEFGRILSLVPVYIVATTAFQNASYIYL